MDASISEAAGALHPQPTLNQNDSKEARQRIQSQIGHASVKDVHFRAGGVTQMLDFLPSMHKALGFIPCTH